MRKRQNSAYIWVAIMLFLLQLFSACASNPSTPPSPQPSSTPTVSEHIFTTAFPPATPLVCPDAPTNAGNTAFVEAAHTQFIYQGKTQHFYGYTFYPALTGGASAWRRPDFPHYIDQVLATGAQAGQNLLRPTDFWDIHYHDQPQDDITIWHNMDYLVCTAARHGVFLVLDISALEWFLMGQQYAKYDIANWKAYLDAVGKHYSNQPAIAFYSIVGEPTPPKNVQEMNSLVNFYRFATDELHKADGGHHLITTGGFNHMEDETPQTPWWQEIYALPNNTVAAFKTYSKNDLDLIPKIAAFTKEIGKPSFDEEFGLPQNIGDSVYSGIQYNHIQSSRAQFYDDVYTRGEANGVGGFVFWNLGCGIGATDYDVSPKTSAVWHVIQMHSPGKLAAPTGYTLC